MPPEPIDTSTPQGFEMDVTGPTPSTKPGQGFGTNTSSPHQASGQQSATDSGGNSSVVVITHTEEEEQRMTNARERVKMKKDTLAKKFLRETVMYAIFMVVFCVITTSLRSDWAFYMTSAIRIEVLGSRTVTALHDSDAEGKPIGSFYAINSDEKFFAWAKNKFLPSVFPATWYNGEKLNGTDLDYLLWYNYRIGKIRMRQVRVKRNEGCDINDKLSGLVFNCLPAYSLEADSQEQFGGTQIANGTQERNITEAFKWQTGEALCFNPNLPCRSPVSGKKGATYPESGFAWDFTNSLAEAQAEMDALRTNGWIDERTRAVMIDFTVYNPGLRLMVATQLLVEFFPTGIVYVTDSLRPMPLLSFESGKDWSLFIGEIVLVISVLLYLIREVQEFMLFYRIPKDRCQACLRQGILRNGRSKFAPCVECGRRFNLLRSPSCPNCTLEVGTNHQCWQGYFQDGWNILDLVNQVFFIVVFSLRFKLRVNIRAYNLSTDDFLLLYPIAWQYAMSNWLNSVNALLCFAKTFKYLGKFKSLSLLLRTFARAKSELLYFLLIFLVIFVGFTLGFHLAFGADIDGYKDWSSSLNTLFLSLFGNFDYPVMKVTNRILAPGFFVLYQLVVFFILANMFIAIISGAHEEAKLLITTGRDDFLSSALKLLFNEWRLKIQGWTGTHENSPYYLVRELLDNLEDLEDLTSHQKEDIMAFRNEVAHNPNNFELFASLLRTFGGRTEYLTASDFSKLKEAVRSFRRSEQVRNFTENEDIWDDPFDNINENDNKMDSGTFGQTTHINPSLKRQSSFAASHFGLLKNSAEISDGTDCGGGDPNRRSSFVPDGAVSGRIGEIADRASGLIERVERLKVLSGSEELN